MNYVRRVFEKDISGRAPRTIINEALMCNGEAQIWVWDAAGAKATRQRILPEYKSKRLPPPENIWPIISLIRQALEHTSALQIQVPRFEADDVIATLCRRFPQEPKFIVSNDADLRQLLMIPNTKIEAKEPTFAVAPKHIRLFKTVVGDPSDNIGGVPGFGKKTWTDVNHVRLHHVISSIMQGEKPEEDLRNLGIPKRCQTWMLENQRKLSDIWTCVGLWDVPQDLINKNTTIGKRDPLKASGVLAEFYQ